MDNSPPVPLCCSGCKDKAWRKEAASFFGCRKMQRTLITSPHSLMGPLSQVVPGCGSGGGEKGCLLVGDVSSKPCTSCKRWHLHRLHQFWLESQEQDALLMSHSQTMHPDCGKVHRCACAHCEALFILDAPNSEQFGSSKVENHLSPQCAHDCEQLMKGVMPLRCRPPCARTASD